MKRIATAVVLIPVVLLLVLRAPVVLLAAVVAAVAILTVRELLDLSTHYSVEPLRTPTYIFAALVFAVVAFLKGATGAAMGTIAIGLICVFAAFVLAAIAMRRADLHKAFPAAAVSVFALAYVAIPLALLVEIRDMWVAAVPGAVWILYMLIIVWSGDTFALYVGKSIGRHKMSPRISPGKTWEGAAASFLGSTALGTLIYVNAYPITMGLQKIGLLGESQVYRNRVAPRDLMAVILLSAAINIAGQLGDLIESLIKRGAGVKDSGTLLPGHGGMLDRIDAMLFAAPVLWCYLAVRVLS
jgi:phosphatidate cytidylyltransferase